MDRSPYTSPYAMFDWTRAFTANPMFDWTRAFTPSRCEVCGRPLAPTGMDWASQWYETTYAPLMENLTRMWGGMAQPWGAPGTTPMQPGLRYRPHQHQHHQHHHHRHDCGCDEGDCDGCRGDRCHCRCCIGDADLVVYARVGERRVVPLTIENPRRRERQVKLELSNWTSRGGAAAGNIKALISEPTEFTLAACQEHEAILLIEASPEAAGDKTPGTAADVSSAAEAAQRRVTDVDDCKVFYADLRVEGCDTRPVRIALALLPRDCAAYTVDCGCSHCC